MVPEDFFGFGNELPSIPPLAGLRADRAGGVGVRFGLGVGLGLGIYRCQSSAR